MDKNSLSDVTLPVYSRVKNFYKITVEVSRGQTGKPEVLIPVPTFRSKGGEDVFSRVIGCEDN